LLTKNSCLVVFHYREIFGIQNVVTFARHGDHFFIWMKSRQVGDILIVGIEIIKIIPGNRQQVISGRKNFSKLFELNGLRVKIKAPQFPIRCDSGGDNNPTLHCASARLTRSLIPRLR
jgi:hypothetical protein